MSDPGDRSLLVVHPHLHPRRTGVTRHVETVVPHLAQELEVTTWGQSLQASLPRATFGELWRRLRGRRAVWHAHRNNELLVGLLLRLLHPALRVVFTRHSATKPGLWTRILARRADRVVGLSADVVRSFPRAVQVVPHGVDHARFRPPVSEEERQRARISLGLSSGPVLAVVGRIRPEKGQGDLIEALTRVDASLLRRWQVALVGRVAPEHRAFAEGLRASLQGQGGPPLHLLPERDSIEEAFRAFDVVVQPSRSEGYSLVVLEAMASGCCVLSAEDVPAARAAIEHGRTGFLYRTGDIDALRSLLAEVLSQPARIREVGAATAATIRERHGLEHEAATLATLYREVGR